MNNLHHYILATVLFCTWLPFVTNAEVRINEIHYNPPDRELEAGSWREFIELYNPGSSTIDLSEYTLSDGVHFRFPEGTNLQPNQYLVIARDPVHRDWRNRAISPLGPFSRKLDDQGETLTLRRSDGSIADQVSYRDQFPWSQGADGYGSSLEKIAWDLPSGEFSSWRSSFTEDGTPGRANSVREIRRIHNSQSFHHSGKPCFQ